MHRLLTIRRAEPRDLAEAAQLLAVNLRFSEADAIPAWFMRTTDECGGVTLVATSEPGVVGASYAFPASEDGTPFLFSCGLAVAPAYRGQRLGVQLKLAQRREALALGYRCIRWTTDPLNGPALRVYLSDLGARVIGYRAGLHDGLRTDPGHPQDDLDIVWNLDESTPLDGTDLRAIELPWRVGADELHERRRVRAQMCELLAAGYVGACVDIDRVARRCRIAFAREQS